MAVAAFLGIALAVVVLPPGGEQLTVVLGQGPPGKGGGARDPHTFEISGEVTGLAPAVERTLTLKVENEERSTIVVESLDVAVGDATASCAGSNVEVGAVPLPVEVRPNGEVFLDVPIRLVATAPDACQGATFPLTYTGTAAKG